MSGRRKSTNARAEAKVQKKATKLRNQEESAAAALQEQQMSSTLRKPVLDSISQRTSTTMENEVHKAQQHYSTETQQQLSKSPSNAGGEGRDDATTVIDKDITPNASTHNLVITTSMLSDSITTSTAVQDGVDSDLIKFDGFAFKCPKPDCRRVTNPWDGSTVICPRCGPYSSIRYCCTQHLLGDLPDHWAVDCLRHTLRCAADPLTIHPRQVQGPPAIPNLCGWDSVERYRQVIYHAAASQGDYFIFGDANGYMDYTAGDQSRNWQLRRGRAPLILTVNFERNQINSANCLKDRFNRLMNAALFTASSNPLILSYMFLMIRENLSMKGEWDDVILNCISYQFVKEFNWQIPRYLTESQRHACPLFWHGEPPINLCPDQICNGEMVDPITGQPYYPNLALKRKVTELERRYWILRVARVYHPSVQGKGKRMKGIGTNNVRPEYKRKFSMGPEWDGCGASMMEIEGAVWKLQADGMPFLESVDVIMGSITV